MTNTKKLLFLLIGLTLTFAAGIFAYSTMSEIRISDWVIYGAIGIIALLSIVIALKKLSDEKKGFVTEDELSKSIREKAAAQSFMYSIYWWAMLLMFTIDSNLRHETVLGIGLVGMCLIFLGLWFYYNNQGVDSENTH